MNIEETNRWLGLLDLWFQAHNVLMFARLHNKPIPMDADQQLQRATKALAAFAERAAISSAPLWDLANNINGATESEWNAAHATVHRVRQRIVNEGAADRLLCQIQILKSEVSKLTTPKSVMPFTSMMDQMNEAALSLGYARGPAQMDFVQDDSIPDQPASAVGLRIATPDGQEWFAPQTCSINGEMFDRDFDDKVHAALLACFEVWEKALRKDDRTPVEGSPPVAIIADDNTVLTDDDYKLFTGMKARTSIYRTKAAGPLTVGRARAEASKGKPQQHNPAAKPSPQPAAKPTKVECTACHKVVVPRVTEDGNRCPECSEMLR